MDLFSYAGEAHSAGQAPLAVRMRPTTLDEFYGQKEIIGNGKFLRRMIESDNVPSLILFGPPGTGKTTLAHIIAARTNSTYEKLNAVTSGVGDIRKIVEAAKDRLRLYQKRTILFIDEIHRFNKSQQDALLPYVEDGTVILIGATTENPYFEVNSPLLSRTRVIRLTALEVDDIVAILERALSKKECGLELEQTEYQKEALIAIAQISAGDARTALNILEQTVTMAKAQQEQLTIETVKAVAGEKIQRYDKNGDNHYDIVSAFIKSMRGSDPDAALHYLARMLAAGEDVKFIARRIVICAAEDVGNADPQALVLAMSAAQAVQFIGMPEAKIPLAQAVAYIACAAKSNAAYVAIEHAMSDVKSRNCGDVPLHLRDSHYKGAKKLGHGAEYRYPHDYEGGWIEQTYLPANLQGITYYHPQNRGKEGDFAGILASRRKKDKTSENYPK